MPRPPETALGRKIRGIAVAYEETQQERAEGIKQAADIVDAALSGDPVLAASVKIDALASAPIPRGALERATDAWVVALRAEISAGRGVQIPPVPAPSPLPPRIIRAAKEFERRVTPLLDPLPSFETGLRAGELLCLRAIAQQGERGMMMPHLGLVTGYKATSRTTYLGRLRSRAAIVRVGRGYQISEHLFSN